MTEPPAVSAVPAAPPPAQRSPAAAAPLFLWLVIQLLALSLAACRVPLWARFPQPGEQFALHVMLITQVLASSLLFPFLLRDATGTILAILTAMPFVQFARYLSEAPLSRASVAMLYLVTWLATLAMWRGIVQTRRGAMYAVACAAAWSIGGVLIWYARAESREPGAVDWSRDGAFGVVPGVIAQVAAPSPPASSWVIALALLTVSAACYVVVRRTRVGRSGNLRAAR